MSSSILSAAGKGTRMLGAPQTGLTVLPHLYPKVRRDDSINDTYHGVKVADPYRWLEDPDSKETQQFVDDQNCLTSQVFQQCETREKFKELMTKLYNYPRYGCPFKRGNRYYFNYNSGLQQQSVLYTQSTLDDKDQKVLMDPNKLSEDGTIALMGTDFSKDGTLVSYNLASGGSDWRTVKLMSISLDSGDVTHLEDELQHVKFSSTAWTHDNKGFFYNRYAKPRPRAGEAGTEVDANKNQMLYYHTIGSNQDQDVFLLAIPESPDEMIAAQVTDDGRYLLVSITSGCQPVNKLWLCDLQGITGLGSDGGLDFGQYDRSRSSYKELPFVKLVDTFQASFEYVANDGSIFTFQTNLSAPSYRIVRRDINASSKEWQDVIPQHENDLLQWAAALKGDSLVVCYLSNVHSVLQLRSLATGDMKQEIPLPGLGSVNGFSGKRDDTEAFFSYTDFVTPGATFRIDVADEDIKAALFRKTELKADVDLSALETTQVFATSKDGTKIPMFVIRRQDMTLDGHNPTLLYGYGGFNISLEPSFSVSRLCFILAYGGVYAVANLRGGGEFGLKWREAGSLLQKQNVFDDFQACAEKLVTDSFCSPEKLSIQGGSNGGLLVAACVNQRPDLYAAALAQVGVMDMLRFKQFTIGHAWTTDFGDVDKAEDFEYIFKYSPLHNVKQRWEHQYPAILLTTADHDDRVVPLHSHKLIATLQNHLTSWANSPQRNPLISRIEVRAGHGSGKPTKKIIEEAADSYSFLAQAMNAGWKID